MVKKLVPAYAQLLKSLKGLNVPEVQLLEPSFVMSDAVQFKDLAKEVYTQLTAEGVPINLVTYYDDVGQSYPWIVALPVKAVSLDFCGVPGATVKSQTLALIKEHGFPADKRLGAGV